MKARWLWLVAAVAIAVVYVWQLRAQLADERLARFNAEASADTSRLVWHGGSIRVHERLAFQQRSAIQLRGELGRVLRAADEQTMALIRVTVKLDGIADAARTGTVTASTVDSTVRELAASIDTSGFHASIAASVPRPPAAAVVRWTIARDPVAIVAALNRDPDGRIALRAMAGDHAMVQIDSARVQVESGLKKTQALAIKGLLVLLGMVVGRALR